MNDPARLSWMKDTPAGEPCFGEHEVHSSFVNTVFFPVNVITNRRGFPPRSYDYYAYHINAHDGSPLTLN
jgi:hypothetical protein